MPLSHAHPRGTQQRLLQPPHAFVPSRSSESTIDASSGRKESSLILLPPSSAASAGGIDDAQLAPLPQLPPQQPSASLSGASSSPTRTNQQHTPIRSQDMTPIFRRTEAGGGTIATVESIEWPLSNSENGDDEDRLTIRRCDAFDDEDTV